MRFSVMRFKKGNKNDLDLLYPAAFTRAVFPRECMAGAASIYNTLVSLQLISQHDYIEYLCSMRDHQDAINDQQTKTGNQESMTTSIFSSIIMSPYMHFAEIIQYALSDT